MRGQNINIFAALSISILLVGCAAASPSPEPPADSSPLAEDAGNQVERRLSSGAPKPGSRRIIRTAPTSTPALNQPDGRQRVPLRRPTPTPSFRGIVVPEATATPAPLRRRPVPVSTPRSTVTRPTATPPPAVEHLRWVQTGPMSIDRLSHQTVLMSNGQVLVAGGSSRTYLPYRLSSAELYDFESGEFSPTGSMSEGRGGHSATVLAGGGILISGGLNKTTEEYSAEWYLRSAEVYDPSSGTFRIVGSMNHGRSRHTATVLEDGGVLIVGGEGYGVNGLSESELFAPAEEAFLPTGSLAANRYGHTATRLPDGRVLVLGGRNHLILKSAEIYDPETGTFSEIGAMNDYRYAHTASLLPDGTVLIVGGLGGYSSRINNPSGLRTVELYDPAANSFTSLPPLVSSALAQHFATPLANGQILFTGTYGCSVTPRGGPSTPCGDAYLYDTDSGTFDHLWGASGGDNGLMNLGRTSHRVSLLPGGDVLVTGGKAGAAGWTDTAEILTFPD